MRAGEGSSWLVPTLNGAPRIRKPPLPAWISAATTPPGLFSDLSTPAVSPPRDRAYERLAYALRVPAVVMAMGLVLLIYETGRTLRNPQFGLYAAAIAASSLILLRQGRSITSDVHLAFWVTAANLGLIKAMTNRSLWRWLPFAGAALGLAILSKGPVALVQTVLPAAIAAATLKWRPPGLVAAGGIAALVCGIIAVPWFAYVMAATPDVWNVWWSEVTRSGATNLRRDSIFTYLSIFPLLAPWTVLLAAGLIVAWRQYRRDLCGVWPIVGLAVPLIVMSLVKDKNERYLLPMLAPAALAAAHGAISLLHAGEWSERARRSLAAAHWGLLLLMCLGIPAAGAIGQILPDRQPWWGWGFAATAAIAMLVLWAWAARCVRRRPTWFIGATMLIMYAVHAVFLHGYRASPPGRSEMKPIADAIIADRPTSAVWYFDPSQPPKPLPQDLQIYLNRVVRVVHRVEDLPAPAVDRVIVMLRREHAPPPTVPGWREVASRPAGKRSWHALAGE
jgi:4-amino-4-deoxy-L-arabinose transferase-like glycosyltransferase